MSFKKPSIILVPGAWHSPSCFSLLTPLLTAAGYKVKTVALPSVGTKPPPSDFTADAAVIRETIMTTIEASEDVLLILHSYGGIPGGAAAEGLSKEDRARAGKVGGIVRIVWMMAYAVDVGVSVVDAIGGVTPKTMKAEDGQSHITAEDAVKYFYNDCDPVAAFAYAQDLQPHSQGSLCAKQTYAAWKYIPSTYILGEMDYGIPPTVERIMSEQVGARGDVVRLPCGHSPFYSMPARLAKVIRTAAGEVAE